MNKIFTHDFFKFSLGFVLIVAAILLIILVVQELREPKTQQITIPIAQDSQSVQSGVGSAHRSATESQKG